MVHHISIFWINRLIKHLKCSKERGRGKYCPIQSLSGAGLYAFIEAETTGLTWGQGGCSVRPEHGFRGCCSIYYVWVILHSCYVRVQLIDTTRECFPNRKQDRKYLYAVVPWIRTSVSALRSSTLDKVAHTNGLNKL